MNTCSFLLELGCEEIPDKQIVIAFESIYTGFSKFLQDSLLDCRSFRVSGTPRRLFLAVEGLESRQADREIFKTGPAVNIAYTKDGGLSPAGMGFLKKNAASVSDSFVQETEKGNFLAVKYVQAGSEALVLLQAWVSQMIPQIPFGKKMIWCDGSFSFSRPLRWIVFLWDAKPIKFDFYGIPSGNITYGNRYLGLDKALVLAESSDLTNTENYLSTLRAGKVIADAEERKAIILEQLSKVFTDGVHSVMDDLRLVETVTNLVEYPTAVVGEFEEKYLALPEKIIISTISQNQKYFSVKDVKGALANKFVFISNGDPQFSALITEGNQKVVNARLADALWYYSEDTKQPLTSFVPRLSDVVFQAKLGTMADKTQRIIGLCKLLAKELQLDAAETEKVLRCALLCKADLLTTMLGEKEFTKLQGYIGKQYALASGEDIQVAEGIYEHYMPRGSADGLPETLCGSIVAIADKMDSVASIIGIGMMPTGSGDPFALRRAANGIVQIISYRSWDLDLYSLADAALNSISRICELNSAARTNLHAFLDQRVVGLLRQQGIAYDVTDSVMHINKAQINDLENRARALQELKTQEDFIRLVIGFKRVANIIAGVADFSPLQTALFAEPAELELHASLQQLHLAIDQALAKKAYNVALQHLLVFGKAIDNFFDAVLVNCEDLRLRENRYALLGEIKQEFLRVADLSLIVLESEI